MGIITNRDIRFETDFGKISDVMTSENLITAPVGTNLQQAQEILRKHKIEKLPIVDDNMMLKGLITIKDIERLFNIQTPPRIPAEDFGEMQLLEYPRILWTEWLPW